MKDVVDMDAVEQSPKDVGAGETNASEEGSGSRIRENSKTKIVSSPSTAVKKREGRKSKSKAALEVGLGEKKGSRVEKKTKKGEEKRNTSFTSASGHAKSENQRNISASSISSQASSSTTSPEFSTRGSRKSIRGSVTLKPQADSEEEGGKKKMEMEMERFLLRRSTVPERELGLEVLCRLLHRNLIKKHRHWRWDGQMVQQRDQERTWMRSCCHS